MKPLTVTLLAPAFALQTYSQVSLPDSSDFKSAEGFIKRTSLSVDSAVSNKLAITASDPAQPVRQSIRISPAAIHPLLFNPGNAGVLASQKASQGVPRRHNKASEYACIPKDFTDGGVGASSDPSL